MPDRLAVVAERAVGRDEVDRPDLLDAQGEGELAPCVAPWNFMPEVLGLGKDVIRAVDAHRLDGRDVERELERGADADRPPLQASALFGV